MPVMVMAKIMFLGKGRASPLVCEIKVRLSRSAICSSENLLRLLRLDESVN